MDQGLLGLALVSVPIVWDAGVVTTVLDDGIPVISLSNRAVVASGLVTTVLDKVFLLFLVFTSDRASRFSPVFLITRFFEMSRTKRRVRRCRILKVVSVCGRIEPFASHNWIFGELIHADAQREQYVLTTLLIGSTSNAISASLSLACLTFRHTELIFWHQSDVSSSCHVVFWPRNSNTIFEGKIQHSRLVKSSILTLSI